MKAGLPGELCLPQALPELLMDALSYRIAMPVTEARIFTSTLHGRTAYYSCPKCHVTLEREFAAFCDRCGQRLDWRDYKHVRLVFPTKG